MTPTLSLEDYFAESWTTRNGLPHNAINSISQSQEGYLWLATWEGVARYNGRTFRLYDRSLETGMFDSGIRGLWVDDDNTVFMAGARGTLTCWQNNTWKSFPLAPAMVNFAMRDSTGRLWIAMEGTGVAYLDEKNQTYIPVVTDGAYRLLEFENKIWMATNSGLYAADVSVDHVFTAKKFHEGNSLNNKPVYALAVQGSDLLIGGRYGALRYRNGKFEELDTFLDKVAVSTILVDDSNSIWLGTISQGVARLHDGQLEWLGVEQGLPHNRVLSMYQDHERSIWVGTNGGLYRLREAPFVNYDVLNGLPSDYIRSVLAHSSGDVFVAGSKGVSVFKDNQIIPLSLGFSSPVSALSLLEGNNGDVLIGTYTRGVISYSPNKPVNVYVSTDDGLPANEIRSMLYDVEGRLWIGTSNGIAIYHNGEVEHLGLADGLPGDFIMALAQDSYGNVWIGTGRGAAIWRDGELKPLLLSSLENAEYAFGFYEQPGQAMWITTDRGLVRYRFEDGAMHIIGKNAGLPVEKMFAVQADFEGDFWLTTNRGILRIDINEANLFSDRKTQSVPFDLFDEGDGMKSSQANGGSTPAATRANDGKIWVATAGGAVSVHPGRLTELVKRPPPVVIESFEQGFEKKAVTDHFVLEPGWNRISIGYAGLSFVMTSKVRYETQLEGFDEQWMPRGTATSVEYTNLPPGEYVFNVRSRYAHSREVGETTKLKITLLPHFWQTLWFQVALGAMVIGGLLLAAKWRHDKVKRHEAALLRLVSRKTHELEKQAKAFEKLSREDELTGLANRRAFDNWVAESFIRCKEDDREIAIAIIDIDRFKRINDRYSHLVGDKAICIVADLLRSEMSDKCRVARWGGEEFTIMLEDGTSRELVELCEKLRWKIQTTNCAPVQHGLQITVSIGVSDSKDVFVYEKVLSQADNALYEAKKTGRNKVVCWKDSNTVSPLH
ncbi:diguanylate cyclase [Parasalinivibrio latis]|uniref:diguanylate cyclase n=1 Tax=Parasalinivibrio latis TaxID=2952610 RepID=UPI0030E1CA81